MNPIEEYLDEIGETKEAVDYITPSAKKGLVYGLGLAAGASALTAATVAAGKLYEAATKTRDFNKMMEFNPHLRVAHNQDPKMFNQMYTSMRNLNSTFAGDPLVAGRYMTRMLDEPASAGGVLTDLAASVPRDKGQFARDIAASGREGLTKGFGLPKH
jgi:hypothetical protein